MKFFVPGARDADEAELALASMARFNGVPVPERRIYRLEFRHNGRVFSIEVGGWIPDYFDEGQQVVCAVLEGPLGLQICLPTRGVLRGSPILVSSESVISKEFFE